MLRYVLPLALLTTPALAQQSPQPSQQAIIEALHTQLMQASDALTLSEARYADAEQQITTLQAKLKSPPSSAQKP